MDFNTKIIILVLILVFIKFFIPNVDNFANTSSNSEECTTELVNPIPAKYSCPTGKTLLGGKCWESKTECKPLISNSSFKIYNPTFKVYLQRIDDNNLEITSDINLATLFNVDNLLNLKYLNPGPISPGFFV